MTVYDRYISDLIEAEYNPRQINKDAFEQLKQSLKRFEAVEPAVINQHEDRKNIIVGGHQRIKAAKSLGWDTFPCVYVNLNRDQERELNIRLNKNTGAFDFDLLANHFEVEELTDWGFTENELFGFMETEEPSRDELVDEKDEKDAVMKITFDNPDHLQDFENRVKDIIDEYEKAYYSVSAGKI